MFITLLLLVILSQVLCISLRYIIYWFTVLCIYLYYIYYTVRAQYGRLLVISFTGVRADDTRERMKIKEKSKIYEVP